MDPSRTVLLCRVNASPQDVSNFRKSKWKERGDWRVNEISTLNFCIIWLRAFISFLYPIYISNCEYNCEFQASWLYVCSIQQLIISKNPYCKLRLRRSWDRFYQEMPSFLTRLTETPLCFAWASRISVQMLSSKTAEFSNVSFSIWNA